MAVITEPFVATAKSMARNHGMPDYPHVALPHPIANLTRDEVRAKAKDFLPSVLAILFGK